MSKVFMFDGNGHQMRQDMANDAHLQNMFDAIMHQCEMQHKTKNPGFRAHARGMKIDVESATCFVFYDNGETWKYNKIDDGPERMICQKVK